MGNAMAVRGLCKKYDGFELKDVGFTLPEGSVMGFIGANGAGKSTTIKLILDIISRDGGEVELLGRDFCGDDADIKEKIGVVFDESGFPDVMTVRDVDLVMKNIYKTWDGEKFRSYAERFELPEKKKIKDFSRGMKMKLCIAAALSHDSRLLILDEATSGLDPVVRDEILDVFLEFVRDGKHSIFVSSHITSDLEKIADYITFIHKGEIVFCEKKDELLKRYSILRCSREEFSKVSLSAIVSIKNSGDTVDALVLRDRLPDGTETEKPAIEDIMLYLVRGEAQ